MVMDLKSVKNSSAYVCAPLFQILDPPLYNQSLLMCACAVGVRDQFVLSDN